MLLMASPTLAPRGSTSRFALKIILAILAALLLIPLGVGGWFYVASHRALPQLDGTVRVSGLSAAVTVVRDQHGVPHITAASMQDLLFAQGYVTAQDRLWQMDMTRRYGNGELSEILGVDYLEADRTQRILGLREVAKRAAGEISAEERALADAYVRGVNAYMDSARGHLPMEFRVLGYSPRPWTVEDSLVCGATFSEMLNLFSAQDIVRRERVEAKVPPELTADLFPTTSWRDHPPLQNEPEIVVEPELPDPDVLRRQLEYEKKHPPKSTPKQAPANVSHAIPALPFAVQEAGDGTQLAPGSNNWVVSGEHTVTGKPLLSNDMHLEHHIPNVWYEVHLTSGDFDVAGVSAPGIPFLIEGHNRRIAWGFTNLNPASLDMYVETFNDKGEYQAPSGWQSPQRRHEVIQVKKSSPVELDVLTTRHGPIVSEMVPGESRKLALRWVLYEPHALALDAFHELNAAGNWDDFRKALSRFASPGQNVVYADVDGHIGYQATGWVPLRTKGDGTRPVVGNVDDYEWNGYLAFDLMPRVFDPQAGIIATANARVTPDGYTNLVSAEWMSPERVDRIYRLLHSDKKFSAADMLAIQTDVYSDYDRFFAERFVYAADHSSRASADAKRAADILRKWDGRVMPGSPAPTIVLRAERELRSLLLKPVLLDPADYRWMTSSVWLENTTIHQPARWLPKQYANWNDLLTDALNQIFLGKAAPRDLAEWNWEKIGALSLQHPVFGRIPLLKRWSGPGLLPQSGNGHTVKQVGRGFGPSQRFTADLSNLDASTMNIVTGEGGNLFSPYYMDQWDAWYRGTTYSLPFSAAAVGKAQAHTLRLEP
jgi:penicillin amidase